MSASEEEKGVVKAIVYTDPKIPLEILGGNRC